MNFYTDFFAPILSGSILGLIFWAISNTSKQRSEKKRFLAEVKALCLELEGNSRGRGNHHRPFQTFFLQAVISSQYCQAKFPQFHAKCIDCLAHAFDANCPGEPKEDLQPGDVQRMMLSLKEQIESKILN